MLPQSDPRTGIGSVAPKIQYICFDGTKSVTSNLEQNFFETTGRVHEMSVPLESRIAIFCSAFREPPVPLVSTCSVPV